MRAVTIRKEYNVNDEYNIFLCSDIHLENPDHNRDLLHKEMKNAVKKNADILIGGDLFDAILPGDRKRYTPSHTKYEDQDAIINAMLTEAVELFTPYAKNIKVILCGNHDDCLTKYHAIDLVALLIYELNKLEGVNIEYLGYSGFIRYQFKYAKGAFQQSYDIYASHGTGGGAVITKGVIGINRQMTANIADLYWSGHTHTKVLLPDEICAYIDQNGNIRSKSRKGIITGAYLYPVKQQKTTRGNKPNSYNVDYGDKMRSYQSSGGMMLTFDIESKENFSLTVTV
jgi:hypothetical protein